MKKQLGATALAVLLLATSAHAWNGKGHMTVAYIAYRNLNPTVRTRVDNLLQNHPDFARLREFAGPANGQNFHLIVFMNAAFWPDTIREDTRFYDETDPESTPTLRLPGFPSMKRFRRWHYISFPFTPDNSPLTDPAPVNALKLLQASRGTLNNSRVPPNRQAYFLSWLLHVAGDVHQPLHCTSRFTQQLSPPENPDGDRGGNEFTIVPFPPPEANFTVNNLHSFWDNVLGTRRNLATISALATNIMAQHPKPGSISTDEDDWIRESFNLARTRVYTINPQTTIQQAYFSNAQRLARERVAIAGYRIAEVLNERFN